MPPITLILAGGRARRMGGGDKGLRRLGDATLLDHVLARLRLQQTRATLLNANGDARHLADVGLPVIPDSVPDRPGPLAGVLAGMEWALAHDQSATDLLTVPIDTPFLPLDLVDRLTAGRDAAAAEIACAASAGQAHHVIALWPVRLAPLLRQALLAEGVRRVDRWTARFRSVAVPFPAEPFDPFMNVNTPDDLAAAEAALAAGAGHFFRSAGG